MFFYFKNKKNKIIFGKLISKILFPKFKFYLTGKLGVGKTFLCKSVIGPLINYSSNIKSPTYNIVEKYSKKKLTFNHFDFYKINRLTDIKIIDLKLYFNKHSTNFMEWGGLFHLIFSKEKLFILIYHYNNIYDRILIINSDIFVLIK